MHARTRVAYLQKKAHSLHLTTPTTGRLPATQYYRYWVINWLALNNNYAGLVFW